jgi:hypothetical protein
MIPSFSVKMTCEIPGKKRIQVLEIATRKILLVAIYFTRYFSKLLAICKYFSLISSPALPKDDFCQVWSKLAQWFWRRRFLNGPTPFLHFCDYLPFEANFRPFI